MADREVVVIGAGPAALAAAISAKKNGARDVLVIERGAKPGGILNQCIHNGFGLHYFQSELTGPEYAYRFAHMAEDAGIEHCYDTMVTDITPERVVTAISRKSAERIRAGAVILAMGCRERPRGALNIPGSRVSGILTAGTAQLLVNMEGYLPGREVVILGSGDIGLIMARRMTLEGAKVRAVCEIMPYSGGLRRNIAQCLEDFDIPLKFSHTVSCIHGGRRLTGVTISAVDENRAVIPGTGEYIPCDLLLLSVGLIPENELSLKAGVTLDPVTGGPVVDSRMETDVDGVFACGNVVHVHDLVDYVSYEGERAGIGAAEFLRDPERGKVAIQTKTTGGVRYCVPQKIDLQGGGESIPLSFRVDNIYRNAEVVISQGTRVIRRIKHPVFTPGEMERVDIRRNILDSGNDLTISLRKDGDEWKPNA